jgi:hypothetical protein
MGRKGFPWGGAVVWLLVAVVSVQADDLRQRQRRIKELTPQEKQELQRREERFRALSPGEQERLRELHRSIEQADDGEALEAVLVRYHAWLNRLRPRQRADLLDLPPEQRIKRIRDLLETQAAERFQEFAAAQLEFEDRRAINEWLWSLLEKHEEDLLQRFSPDHRQMVERFPRSSREFRGSLYFGLRAIQPQEWDFLSPESIDVLREKLSAKARDALDREQDPRKRAHLVGEWARAAIFSRRGWQPPVSEDELMKFFNEHIAADERARLESLPSEQLRAELERRYHFFHGVRQRGGQRGEDPGGRGRIGRPGAPRPSFGDDPRRSRDRSDDR